jgi:hypothetical protein
MPTVIVNERYNTLINLVNKVLGTSGVSEPTYGYGQSTSTSTVSGTAETGIQGSDKITAEQYRNLYVDIIKARAHQVGSGALTINPFVVGDVENNPLTADKVEEAYIIGLESIAADLDVDRFLIDSTQGDAENLKTSVGANIQSTYVNSTNGNWNGTLTHIVDVEFADAAARRHFFNAGGEIRFSANVDYAGSQAKTVAWQEQLDQMGTISFKAQETVSNVGIGTGSLTGNYQLTTTYQLCYRQNGGAVYSENTYDVYALSLTDDTIRFKIEFVDSVPSAAYYYTDEDVFGDFTSIFSLFRPSGTVTINGTEYPTVELVAPTGVEVTGL